jgi:RimJ/RimL family protein N-acetyltransferase
VTTLFFMLRSEDAPPTPAALAEGYAVELWRPTPRQLAPPGANGPILTVWWAMHHLGLFANRDYAQLTVRRAGRLVHCSGVFPRFPRFPFMAADDLQIGATWTDQGHRGLGLAVHAIVRIVRELGRPGRRFWYLTDASNAASVRAVEKAGFSRVAEGRKVPRYGMPFLGAYVPDSPPRPAAQRHGA